MLRWFLIAILAAGLTMAVIIAPSLISKPANTASDDLKFPTKTPELSGPAPKAAVDHPPPRVSTPGKSPMPARPILS
jgi:hypothetical protein